MLRTLLSEILKQERIVPILPHKRNSEESFRRVSGPLDKVAKNFPNSPFALILEQMEGGITSFPKSFGCRSAFVSPLLPLNGNLVYNSIYELLGGSMVLQIYF